LLDPSERAVTITYPLSLFLTGLASPRNRILPDFCHLAVEHPASVLPQPSFPAPRYIQGRDSVRFSFQRWQTQASLAWGV
jgi:hypothetical protein